MASTERWRWVPGWEGDYEVSDHGNVRSYKRQGRGDARRAKPRLLRPGRLASGHRNVNLCRAGKGRTHLVHRLVLGAFVGPCPEGMEACHNNGDPADNRVENLRWDTRLSNMQDKVEHGTTTHKCGTHGVEARDEDIRRLWGSRLTLQQIGDRHDLSRERVRQIASDLGLPARSIRRQEEAAEREAARQRRQEIRDKQAASPANSPAQRRVLAVRDQLGVLSDHEIAARLGVHSHTVGVVRNRLGIKPATRDNAKCAPRGRGLGRGEVAYRLRAERGIAWRAVSARLGVHNACALARDWASRTGSEWPIRVAGSASAEAT